MFEKYKNKINIENENKKIVLSDEEIKQQYISKEKEKIRRRMAITSLSIIIGIILYTGYNPDITDNQVTLFSTFGLFLSSVVVSYFGGNYVKEIKA